MTDEPPSLIAVIPALNAAAGLPATLECIGRAGSPVGRIVVSDGGSTDETVALAEARNAVVVAGEPGRGGQLSRGADAAKRERAEWLLFLHADTVLAPGWEDEVKVFIAAEENMHRAAVFRFALDDESRSARRLEAVVRWRCRFLALPYGDQGLLISRPFYDSIGGFREMALMEDVDLVRRIGRARLRYLSAAAVTSASRYRQRGYLRRMVRNATCLLLFFLGVGPDRLARLYD